MMVAKISLVGPSKNRGPFLATAVFATPNIEMSTRWPVPRSVLFMPVEVYFTTQTVLNSARPETSSMCSTCYIASCNDFSGTLERFAEWKCIITAQPTGEAINSVPWCDAVSL